MVSESATARGEQLKILRAGQWHASKTTRWSDVHNPSTGEVIAAVPLCSADEVDEVIASAAEALPETHPGIGRENCMSDMGRTAPYPRCWSPPKPVNCFG